MIYTKKKGFNERLKRNFISCKRKKQTGKSFNKCNESKNGTGNLTRWYRKRIDVLKKFKYFSQLMDESVGIRSQCWSMEVRRISKT